MKVLRRPQRGVALLLFLFLLFGLGTTLFLSAWNANAARLSLEAKTTDALAQAKEALIGRAVSDDNRPGSLPCPDTNGDGVAEPLAGNNCPSYVGRIPYKTLKLSDLRDAGGELLWYALSPSLRDHISASPINPNTPTSLTIDGTPNIAAIVFSPGPPLAAQGGRPSNQTGDYLDGSNGDGDSNFVSGPASIAHNDRALTLTRSELFAAVSLRILGEIRGPDDDPVSYPNHGLRRYYGDKGSFPSADTTGDGFADSGNVGGLPYRDIEFDSFTKGWLTSNGWFTLTNYERVSANQAIIRIGTAQMKVIPCPASPCP